jgi:PAS domain S-box-containing protein
MDEWMKRLVHARHWQGVLWLIIALLSLGWFIFLSHVNERFVAVDRAWSDYNQQSARYNSVLAELIQHLGYGGMIHHFKNYVLRQEPRYLSALKEDFTQMDALLSDFVALNLTTAEQQQVLYLRQVVAEYHQQQQLAVRLVDQGYSPAAIDQQVKVDDRPALAAIAFLRERALQRSRDAEVLTQAAIVTARHRLAYGYLMIGVFVVFGMMLLVLFRVQMQARLAAQQAFQRVDNLLAAVPDAMLIVDQHGRVMRCNSMACTLFGYSEAALIGLAVEALMPAAFRHKHEQLRRSYMAHPHSRLMGDGMLLHATHSDGHVFPVEISLSFDDSADALLITLTVRDVSEREQQRKETQQAREKAESALHTLKQAQTALVESEKLAALGNLVAGVAHEVNTPVGLSLTAASYLRDKSMKVLQHYHDDALTMEGLEQYLVQTEESTRLIEGNARRAAELIQSFKQIAVDQTFDMLRTFDLATYLQEIALSFQASFKRTPIVLEVHCPDDIAMHSYPGALAQLLSNIINNALMHAFPDGKAGTVSITARRNEGDIVEIICQDDGCGMDAYTTEHLFEPFFTTRRGLGGSGLGMYIVHNLVRQQLQGYIHVTSSDKQGSRFEVHLPCCIVNDSR